MIMQIAWGIFLGFILIVVLLVVILSVAYIIGKKQDEVPKFIEEPRKRKQKAKVKEWWKDDEI